jgi:hypothetical protein
MLHSKTSKFALCVVISLGWLVSLSAAQAKIQIFNVVGSFADAGVILAPSPIPISDTLTVDVTAGSIISADILVPTFNNFTNVIAQPYESFHYTLVITNDNSDDLFIDFINTPPGDSLVGFASGVIIAGTVFNEASDIPVFASLSGTITAIPEPSTWAMVALGFAGLGFVSYSQRQKLAGVASV